MTDQKLLEVFRYYRDGILSGIKAEQMEEKWYLSTHIPTHVLLRHLAWMCGEVLAEGTVTGDKAHRWLGYIQGEFRAMGYFSITQLRQHSREE